VISFGLLYVLQGFSIPFEQSLYPAIGAAACMVLAAAVVKFNMFVAHPTK
jgi:uncharacterized membrane protein